MDRPCVGELYNGIDSMLEKIEQTINDKEQDLQETFFKQLQVATSFASKRNWSTDSFIHWVKRNRLQSKKAKNLVFVHYNLRLLSHKSKEYKEGETKKRDVGAEIADLNGSTARLTLDDFEEFDANNIVATADPNGLSSITESTNVGEDEEEEDED